MAKSNTFLASVDELYEDLSDLKLRIALLKYHENELALRVQNCEKDHALQLLIKQGESHILRHIQHVHRAKQVREVISKTVPLMLRMVAGLLLISYIGLSVAIATDSSTRIKVLDFITTIEDRYTSFEFRDTGKFLYVPSEWEGYYYPTYIPVGMTLSFVDPENVVYSSVDGTVLDFDDMNEGAVGTIDTEGAVIDVMMVNGHEAMVVKKEPWTSILWNIDNRVILVSYSGDQDEAIRIAESVQMIK